MGRQFIVAEELREEALRLAHGTPVAIRIEDGLEHIREKARKQRAIGSNVDAFVQLCRSISAECWKNIQGNDRLQNLAILKAAFSDYQRQVTPWFAIMRYFGTLHSCPNAIPRSRNGARRW